MEIILATGNKHKVEEANRIVGNNEITFILPPEGFDPIENGKTFEENSLIKAKAANALTNQITLADDSGLCIEALNGAPGLYSARYADTQQARIDRVLKELDGVNNRRAKFICCMTLLNPNGDLLLQTTGECKGKIITTKRGVNGFGYDPIFMPDEYNITIAEMSEDMKNSISHRGNALRKILQFIKETMYNA